MLEENKKRQSLIYLATAVRVRIFMCSNESNN